MGNPPRSRCDFRSDRLLVQLDETIPADVQHIDPLVTRILAVTRDQACGGGQEFEIETAIREALANAIVHGAKRDPTKKVEVFVACDEDRGILIVVRDPGEGFDPQRVPSPLRGKNLYSHHGRGIYLINQLMDEVRFERNGTEIHMLKKSDDNPRK